jgi:hypothetical protein
MPVGVVRTHRDEGDPSAGGGQETRVCVGAAVVRNLEHVRPQVCAGGNDPGLRCGTQVTREEDPDAAVSGPGDHGEIVRGRGGGGQVRRRGQDLDRRLPHGPAVARDQDRPLAACTVHERVERGPALVGGRQRAGGHHADVPPVEGARQTADVVGVEVREQDEGQRVDPQPVQATVHGPHVGPCIDEHTCPGAGRQDEGIPLADVAGDDHRLRRRPAEHHLSDRPAEDDQAEQGGESERAQPDEPPEHSAGSEDQDGEHGGATGSGRPPRRPIRDVGRVVGHHHQPANGPAGGPDERVGERRADGTHHRGHQTEHGGRRNRRCRHKVRRQGHQTDSSGQPGNQGRGGQAGSSTHRQGVGQEGRPPSPFQSA